jgi:TIR domain
MKVFISWSGDRSRAAGLALRQWLPRVFQNIDIWMSTDIPAGAMWLNSIMEELKGASFGIVCITPENRERSWIQFEAGAIAKAIENTNYVCPYLISLRGVDLQHNPLSNFQYKESNEKGTKELVESINQAIEKPLEASLLKETFDMWWPRLRDELSQIPEPENKAEIESKPQDMLSEILEGMRRIERSIESGIRIRTNFSTADMLADVITPESDPDYRRRVEAGLEIIRSRDRKNNPD